MATRGTDGASRTRRSNGRSNGSTGRRAIRNKDRRSKLTPENRREHTVIERHPLRWQNEPIGPGKRRPRHQNFDVTAPVRLPITREELDAVERLLGRSLRDLLFRQKQE